LSVDYMNINNKVVNKVKITYAEFSYHRLKY
jgi:hypothetical protein